MLQLTAASLAIAATGLSLVALLVLHLLSPEFQPSWRMVSEYANGRHGWLLSLMFATWGIGSLALAVALAPHATGWMGRLGLLFLVLAGTGEIMAAVFDINHRLHGPAAAIGMPSLPVAAVLLTLALRRVEAAEPPAWSMHLTWLAIVAMGVGMMLFMRALAQAGVDLSAQTRPLAELPSGVTPFVGWANRFVVVAYGVWVLAAAIALLRQPAP